MSGELKIIENGSSLDPWYKDGLRFSCTECGKCCTGSPGYVWVTEEEILQIANYLKMEFDQFTRRYLRRINGKLALVEMSKTYDCVFLKNRQCTIYPVRPKQCKTYPWWPQNLKSEKDWQAEALYCEGIRNDAATVPISKIEQQLNIQIGTP